MITLLTTLLVLLSLALVVTIPVALAVPGEWENTNRYYFAGVQIWTLLVVGIAILDGLSQIPPR